VVAVLIQAFVLLLADQPSRATDHLIAVTVPPDQTCPAPRQVTDALIARLPGVVLPHGQTARPGMLRLAVATDSGGSIRLDLADPDGAPLLHRVLAVTRGPGECAALADTIALIIERYWREVGYDAPPTPPPAAPTPPPSPAPPPPPAPVVRTPEPTPAPAVVETRRAAPAPSGPAVPLRWSLAAALAGRAGDGGARDGAASIALAVESHIGFRLSAGVGTGSTAGPAVVETDFRRFPLRLGGYLPIALGIGQLEPGLGIDLDLISYTVRNDTGRVGLRPPAACSGGLCRSPGADVALGWSLSSSRHVYVRGLARAGISAPYDFALNDDQIWRTPRTYLEVALESGFWFP